MSSIRVFLRALGGASIKTWILKGTPRFLFAPTRWCQKIGAERKEETEMTLDEAVKTVKFYICAQTYITSDKVYEKSKLYHNGDNNLFVEVCKKIASEGIDVVDDCFEDAYKIIFNIDNEGESLGESDAKTLIERVKEVINSNVSSESGKLMRAGYIFGIVSSQSLKKNGV